MVLCGCKDRCEVSAAHGEVNGEQLCAAVR